MALSSYIQEERTKNIKALALTLAACAVIAFVLFFIHWQNVLPVPPVLDNGIEVNLGYGDEGLGDIAPLVPGEPAPDVVMNQEESAAPAVEEAPSEAAAKTAEVPSDEVEVHKEVVKNKDKEVPAIRTTANPKSTRKNTKAVEKLTAVETKKPQVAAKKTVVANVAKKAVAPSAAAGSGKAAAPKALYRGGNGPGGNNADSYNGVTSQGIAGGRGDQGRPNGNLTSDSYAGNGGTGKSGVSIREGLSGRRIIAYPSFTDNFNQNAKVAVKIVVDSDGNVTSASVNPQGTTTTNAGIRNIALKKARQLKLSKSSAKAQTGTILFNFKLTG